MGIEYGKRDHDRELSAQEPAELDIDLACETHYRLAVTTGQDLHGGGTNVVPVAQQVEGHHKDQHESRERYEDV
ncbi:MAG: hypothetical protein M0Z68_11045 [Gammaproteobacteria bacterium]|nr:hypothetical protein [Gammaproteobacteria bacterium]